MKATAILRGGGDHVSILAPYRPQFIEAIKARIPRSSRWFDADARSWDVFEPYIGRALALAAAHYGAVERVVPEAEARPAPAWRDSVRRAYPHHAALDVMPGASLAVVRAAYRALALEHHPDRVGAGGHVRMIELNRAYEALRGPQ